MAKKRVTSIFKGAVIALFLLMLVNMLGGCAYYKIRPQPQVTGELKVAGLKERVEILRDAGGKPHIYANNMRDLFFAQGYVQAQDRWWQMEFFRKTCGGRIEELTGRKVTLVNSDIYLRSLGLYKVAEQEYNSYSAPERAALDAFAAGVNAYIAGRSPQQLSFNYSILGLTGVKFKVEPWSPLDTLVFSKLMAWDLGLSRDLEITRARLYAKLGPKMAEHWLVPPWPHGLKPTTLLEEDIKAMYPAALAFSSEPREQVTAGVTQIYDDLAADLSHIMGQTEGIGTNSWVATGSMTSHGKALLANDPHLGIQQPSIWYEIALHCPDDGTGRPFDVTGFTFALSPGVVAGHNNDIAWGNSNVYPDVNDLYQIKVNSANPLQYEWNGKWRDMTVREETIRFGEEKPSLNIKVRITHLGPIINENRIDPQTGEQAGFNNKDPLALRWTGLQPSTITLAILKLNRARNWNDFIGALKYWDTPSQNIVYADRKGNIGLQMPGKIPVRAKNHTGQVPVPGWTDKFEWKGYVPYELMPRLYNPARKYIVASNQEIAPPRYFAMLDRKLGPNVNAHFGSKYNKWVYGYRSQRTCDLMQQLAPHSVATYQAIQGDNLSIPAQEIMPALTNLQFADAELAAARDWLMKWDAVCGEGSPHAVLFNFFVMKLMQNTFQNKIGDIGKADGIDKELWAITLLLQNPNDPWWDDPATPDKKETRDEILIKSFAEAYAAAKAAQGNDRDKWNWGRLHTATFVSNPLGASRVKLLEGLVNRGPVPTSGSTETVNNNIWYASKGNFGVGLIPSMRMIVDLADFDQSVKINSTGVSGHPGSKWYEDQMAPWAKVEYRPMLWSREKVEAAAMYKLYLNP
ncbi:MAG TPA: penicillin acylase family protein [Smithellaceae bacterium]|nr:penicillin acylase family protein [Smithellaceae bacterium]HRS89483.1 penicillin acylase family protein [Smithellaceae bacterium]HRV26432.1 penicillin acylase family protein [Smithellaceae bacterium]